MVADLIVHNIGTLWTPKPNARPAFGSEMSDIREYTNAFIAVKDGKILALGESDYSPYVGPSTHMHDAQRRLVTPGLVDSHTHVVHYGSREHEFDKRLRGVPYLKILEEGGGILSTVRSTKEASYEDLFDQSKQGLERLMLHGVTTVEGKSGYGLDEENELKQLRVQKALNYAHPLDIVGTYLGAHALPKAYEDDRTAFLEQVVSTMDVVKKEALAEFVDVFCEKGVFTVEESEYILKEAKDRGFLLKIHADEMEPLGGTEMAARLGAVSADHLMAVTESGIDALASQGTIATVLPSTAFNLGSDYAPARKMVDAGVALAVSTDYNPGSSPSENFLFALSLAAIHMKLSPKEVLTAATLNGAHSLNRGSERGVLDEGYAADFIIYEADNFPYVLYHFAINHVNDVFKDGRMVVRDKQSIWEAKP